MKSGIRKGILSDESVLINCPDQQSIPLNKMHLAARSGSKISRPQKASYMYQNLPLPQSQKEELIRDFNLRSQKAKPLVIPARQYSTLSLDKPNALVAQVATQSGGGVARDLTAALINAVTQTNSDATTQTKRPTSATSVAELTETESRSGSPEANYPYSDDEQDETESNVRENDGDTGEPTREEIEQEFNLQRGRRYQRTGFGIVDPMASAPSTTAPPATPIPTDILQSRIYGFGSPIHTPTGTLIRNNTSFSSAAGSGRSAARTQGSTHYANPIQSGATSYGQTSNVNLITRNTPNTPTRSSLPPQPLAGQPANDRARRGMLP